MSMLIKTQQIWVAQAPVDFRQSIDGLCGVISEHFHVAPQDGLYVFYNKQKNRLKLLIWHYNGFMLIYKRLERGRFPFRFSDQGTISIKSKQLEGLLLGLDWQTITEWENIKFDAFF
jgi:transposase